MQIRYSPTADALYIRLADGEHGWTDDLGGLRHVDYGKDGMVLGVEILNPRVGGVDLTDVPQADEIGAELIRLGFKVKQPAA
jgi:uncharacterized protein YuzE